MTGVTNSDTTVHPTRRTVASGLAWSVPVILVATKAPAVTTSRCDDTVVAFSPFITGEAKTSIAGPGVDGSVQTPGGVAHCRDYDQTKTDTFFFTASIKADASHGAIPAGTEFEFRLLFSADGWDGGAPDSTQKSYKVGPVGDTEMYLQFSQRATKNGIAVVVRTIQDIQPGDEMGFVLRVYSANKINEKDESFVVEGRYVSSPVSTTVPDSDCPGGKATTTYTKITHPNESYRKAVSYKLDGDVDKSSVCKGLDAVQNNDITRWISLA